MQKYVPLGFISLILLILFFTYFLNREWFKNVVKTLIITVLIYTLFIGCILTDKYIREERTTYDSIDEVIEENYKYKNVNMIEDEGFYYLIIDRTKQLSSSKEKVLIRFDDNKYTKYDKYAEWIGNVETKTTRIKEAGTIIEYEIGDEFIVIVLMLSRSINYKDIDYVYDDNQVWNFASLDGYYYINVVDKDDYTDDYKIYARTESEDYQLVCYEDDYYKFIWERVKE